jgi:hypothetical protein
MCLAAFSRQILVSKEVACLLLLSHVLARRVFACIGLDRPALHSFCWAIMERLGCGWQVRRHSGAVDFFEVSVAPEKSGNVCPAFPPVENLQVFLVEPTRLGRRIIRQRIPHANSSTRHPVRSPAAAPCSYVCVDCIPYPGDRHRCDHRDLHPDAGHQC